MLGTACHHSVIRGNASQPHSVCLAHAEQIRRQHLATGYSTTAYNEFVCPHGLTIPGRGYGRPSGANGTTWANLNYWAICLLFDARFDPFTDAMKRGWRAAWQRTPAGGNKSARPHSDFFATYCCGDTPRAWIAAGLPVIGGAPLPSPAPSPAPTPGPVPPLIARRRGDMATVEDSKGVIRSYHPRNGELIETPGRWQQGKLVKGGEFRVTVNVAKDARRSDIDAIVTATGTVVVTGPDGSGGTFLKAFTSAGWQ